MGNADGNALPLEPFEQLLELLHRCDVEIVIGVDHGDDGPSPSSDATMARAPGRW